MQRLKSALVREYEENSEDIKVYNPRNTVGVDFYFTGEKTAKVCLVHILTQYNNYTVKFIILIILCVGNGRNSC